MSIYLGDKLLAGASEKTTILGFDLFDHKWSDHILNDMSWLRADTFSWQSGEVYKSAYDHLVEDFNGTTSATETIGSQTITYYQATDGHKIVLPDMEATVRDIYNETGVAWYYILDVANKRFKLPRELPITDKSKGNGGYIYMTNSNGEGYIRTTNQDNVRQTGTLYVTQGGSYNDVYLTTDPTKSGIISHRENENGKQYLYFYVGNYTKSAIEQTAGLNSELFNGKMDRDMSNMNASQSAKETIVSWGMPDYSAGVTIQTSSGGTYTVPQNGYIEYKLGYSGSNAISINDTNSSGINILYIWTQNNQGATSYLPVTKNQIIYFKERTGTVQVVFYPAIGG